MNDNNAIFSPISSSEVKEKTSNFETAYQLLGVTLTTGDILIGGLAKHWGWNGHTVDIGYNNEKGKRFGGSYIAAIPLSLIAEIQPIPLDEGSLPKLEKDDAQLEHLKKLGIYEESFERLCVQDYPNPLARIICSHNNEVCNRIGIKLTQYFEMALSRDSIPTKGIIISKNFLLYADWDYFSRQKSGSVSLNATIGLVGISKDLCPSLQNFILSFLLDTGYKNFKKLENIGLPSLGEECMTEGYLIVPGSYESTEIEGESTILIACASSKNEAPLVSAPVLLKKRSLRYPLEFLNQISSPLQLYGEMLPIPIRILGKKHNQTMLAQAIGYIKK